MHPLFNRVRLLSRASWPTVLILLGPLVGAAAGQTGERRATVVTSKGDTVDGAFKSASAGSITLEVAGQTIVIPVETIKYISFVGPLAGTGSPAASSPTNPIEDAFAAVAELRTVTEIGVLRTQWADKVLAAAPRVRGFTRNGTPEWHDVKALLDQAIEEYSSALSNWEYASFSFERGAKAADLAKKLAGDPDERTHVEPTAEERALAIGESVSGRLGFGDRRSEGGYEEVFILTLPSRTKVSITASCTVKCDMEVSDRSKNKSLSKWSKEFKKTLEPGIYAIAVRTTSAAMYSLQTNVER